jgi:hypothetical protein
MVEATMQGPCMAEVLLDRVLQVRTLVLSAPHVELAVVAAAEVAASHMSATGKAPTSKRQPTSTWDVEGISM